MLIQQCALVQIQKIEGNNFKIFRRVHRKDICGKYLTLLGLDEAFCSLHQESSQQESEENGEC